LKVLKFIEASGTRGFIILKGESQRSLGEKQQAPTPRHRILVRAPFPSHRFLIYALCVCARVVVFVLVSVFVFSFFVFFFFFFFFAAAAAAAVVVGRHTVQVQNTPNMQDADEKTSCPRK
jgi:hypothetical protein